MIGLAGRFKPVGRFKRSSEKMVQNEKDDLKVGLAQISPVWLDRDRTLVKVLDYVGSAGVAGCDLVAFGEGILPGYPFWIERSHGAEFNSPVQKEIHAHYLVNAVQIESGHLDPVCKAARENNMAVMIGIIERPVDRGGHSLYASLVYIDGGGTIQSIHRKLVPTYEERLTWAPGDGHGLRTHRLGRFTVGGLNCWENWMPLARAALYGQGEDLHVAVWPGSTRNTNEITRYIAFEARSFVISVSGLMRKSDIPADTPRREMIGGEESEILADGGSCLAAPDGSWVIEPVREVEKLVVARIEHKRVREERQNLDPAGHYARPDVLRLLVDRRRQSAVEIIE
jgi:nitrilase